MNTIESRLTAIEDEAAIRALSNKYADAANRVDAALFTSLWTEKSEWIIGPPISQKFEGRDNIVHAFIGLLGSWDFFVQLPVGGNVEIKGTSATTFFYVNEIARDKDGKGNYNLAQYKDELIKENGVWKFVKRDYRVIYLDQEPLKGLSFKLS